MIDCEFCKEGCFPSEKDECIAITFSNDTLDIKSGRDSLKSTLIKLTDEVSSLKDTECDPCNKCKGVTSTSTSNSTTPTVTNIIAPTTSKGSEAVTLTVSPSSNTTIVSYDARSAISEEGATSANTSVSVYGSKSGISGRLHTSSAQLGSFNVAPENFPITLSIEVTTVSGNGQKLLKLSRSLLNANSTIEECFNVTSPYPYSSMSHCGSNH